MAEHQWKKEKNGDIDEFVLDVEDSDWTGHNGPRCEVCGFECCVFCVRARRKDLYDPVQFPCAGPPPEGKTWYFETGVDPSSTPDGTWED